MWRRFPCCPDCTVTQGAGNSNRYGLYATATEAELYISNEATGGVFGTREIGPKWRETSTKIGGRREILINLKGAGSMGAGRPGQKLIGSRETWAKITREQGDQDPPSSSLSIANCITQAYQAMEAHIVGYLSNDLLPKIQIQFQGSLTVYRPG